MPISNLEGSSTIFSVTCPGVAIEFEIISITEYFDKKPRRPTKKHQPSFQEIRTPIKNDCIKGGLEDREQLPYPYAENKKAHH